MQHPFKVREFIKENTNLVKKYIRKDTYELIVPDFVLDKHEFYKGNLTIPNVKFNREYSQIQKLEYIKCMKDVIYFTQKYIKIISIDDGVIPFKLYPYQAALLRKLQIHRFVISLQARQTGKTQVVATFLLWYGLFHGSKKIAILANKASQAKEILSRIQLSYENLPFFIKQPVTVYNKTSIEFGNYSDLFTAATSSSSIRGKSVSVLYIDEGAFIPNDMEFYESTYPVISSGKRSRVIMTSTPNGTKGLFHKLWNESVGLINKFINHKVIWSQVPGRDNDWREEQISNTSREQFDQEHNCLFRGSQNSLISGHILAQLVKSIPIIEKDNGLKIYHEPINNHRYFCTVDVGRGVGGDYSAFVIFDVSVIPYKVVATYRNNTIAPIAYPTVIYNVASYYNQAFVLVEVNDMGEGIVNTLFYDFEYENLLPTSAGATKQTLGYAHNQKFGVRTTTQVKAVGCSNVKNFIEAGKVELSDENIIDEFGNFVQKGRSYEADKGAHDDLVMCVVLFAWSATQEIFKELTNSDISKRIISDYTDDEIMPMIMGNHFNDRDADDFDEMGDFESEGFNNDMFADF